MKEIPKEALTYAFNLLSIADRSEKILHEKILKRFDQESADRVIEYLKDNNFVNDGRYAGNLVESYLRIRNYGRNRIKIELIKKKIPQDIISNVLANIEDEETGCALAAKNWLRKKGDPEELDYATRNKLLAFLMRRGFDYETAKTAITEAITRDV